MSFMVTSVGPPENDCVITPTVSESSANFIEGLVMNAKQKGATFCKKYNGGENLIWHLLLDKLGHLELFCQQLG
ncbi:hypothetical protein TSUD_72770 [Trifolium subterraneum]|uniref:Uncharacterized protein n=1 Tax=Trifolium subterraneum TaxID=3900 RepID=A0A2Z6LGR0_TRISU|nr:hypothetical protein TSUD_72770 [Trifolium subterraneum]